MTLHILYREYSPVPLIGGKCRNHNKLSSPLSPPGDRSIEGQVMLLKDLVCREAEEYQLHLEIVGYNTS